MPLKPAARLPALLQWTVAGRAVVFFLAATSIWCLLAEFYGLCSMADFTFFILIPSTLALIGISIVDRRWGDGRLFRGVMIGIVVGFVAVVAYDLFRVPYVYAASNAVGPAWLRLPLFKVFPRFGAMILSQPIEQTHYSLSAHVVGWLYHFSNGAMFGVMYVALIGELRRRAWGWAVLMAVGLEVAMLATPYTRFFSIRAGSAFIVATVLAHLIFGVVMGLGTRWSAARWPELDLSRSLSQ